MRKSSVFGLDLQEGPPWSVMSPEAMVESVVRAAAPSRDETRNPWGCQQCVPLPEDLVVSSDFAASGGQVDVRALCSHLKPR